MELLLDLFWHAPGSYLWELDDNYFRNEAAWNFWKSDLEDLRRVADENGICLMLLIHTALTALNDFYPYKPNYDTVSEVARRNSLAVIDQFPYFRSKNGVS